MPSVPPKVAGRKRDRNLIKPLSGLDVTALLSSSKKRKIAAENPIPSFRQMLDVTESVAEIHDAAKQLGDIIQAQIKESFGDAAYGKVVEELSVMREEMSELEEPGVWNEFISMLKKKLLGEELGGDRREMWWEIRKHKLGLVHQQVSPQSNVTEAEAKEVCSNPPALSVCV